MPVLDLPATERWTAELIWCWLAYIQRWFMSVERRKKL